MSVAEVIEIIDKLSPEERAEVSAFLEKRKAEEAREGVRYLPQAEAERLANQIFNDHHELFRRLAQ